MFFEVEFVFWTAYLLFKRNIIICVALTQTFVRAWFVEERLWTRVYTEVVDVDFVATFNTLYPVVRLNFELLAVEHAVF